MSEERKPDAPHRTHGVLRDGPWSAEYAINDEGKPAVIIREEGEGIRQTVATIPLTARRARMLRAIVHELLFELGEEGTPQPLEAPSKRRARFVDRTPRGGGVIFVGGVRPPKKPEGGGK